MFIVISMIWKLDVRTVGHLGELPSTLPLFLWPQAPLTLATLWIILPYSIVDEMTDTPSDKDRECTGQGIANFVSGFFGRALILGSTTTTVVRTCLVPLLMFQ